MREDIISRYWICKTNYMCNVTDSDLTIISFDYAVTKKQAKIVLEKIGYKVLDPAHSYCNVDINDRITIIHM